VRFQRDDDRDDDAEPFELHNFDKYSLQGDAMRARLDGRAGPIADRTALQTGALPPGPLGIAALHDLAHATERFAAMVEREHGRDRAAVTIVRDDYVVRGELDGLSAQAMVLWRPAKLKAKDRLRAFIAHVVKCAAIEAGGALPQPTVLIGSDARIEAPPCSPAGHHLDALVGHYRSGRCAPLPYFSTASAVYWAELDDGAADPVAKARRAYERASWEGDWSPHDLPDPHLEFCFQDRDPVATPEFARLAADVFGRAAGFFGGRKP
jgi:exodeoxyribonuclease V gamma subunit